MTKRAREPQAKDATKQLPCQYASKTKVLQTCDLGEQLEFHHTTSWFDNMSRTSASHVVFQSSGSATRAGISSSKSLTVLRRSAILSLRRLRMGGRVCIGGVFMVSQFDLGGCPTDVGNYWGGEWAQLVPLERKHHSALTCTAVRVPRAGLRGVTLPKQAHILPASFPILLFSTSDLLGSLHWELSGICGEISLVPLPRNKARTIPQIQANLRIRSIRSKVPCKIRVERRLIFFCTFSDPCSITFEVLFWEVSTPSFLVSSFANFSHIETCPRDKLHSQPSADAATKCWSGKGNSPCISKKNFPMLFYWRLWRELPEKAT